MDVRTWLGGGAPVCRGGDGVENDRASSQGNSGLKLGTFQVHKCCIIPL